MLSLSCSILGIQKKATSFYAGITLLNQKRLLGFEGVESYVIDIHTHVLPALREDDGPKSAEKSLQMIKTAANEGITGIVATPHMLKPLPDRKAEIFKAIESLGQNLVTLYPGTEVFADDHVLEQEHLITLGNSNYLLIEFPRAQLPQHTADIFFDLQTRDYQCIFAHPERNGSIVEDPNRLIPFIQAGVLCQVNAGSILGRYGKESQKTAQIILEHGMAHFIASDMHSTHHRYYSLNEAIAEASKYTKNAQDLVTTNPEIILRGDYLEPEEPKPYKKRGLWFFKRR